MHVCYQEIHRTCRTHIVIPSSCCQKRNRNEIVAKQKKNTEANRFASQKDISNITASTRRRRRRRRR
jgi:hypothetical protein